MKNMGTQKLTTKIKSTLELSSDFSLSTKNILAANGIIFCEGMKRITRGEGGGVGTRGAVIDPLSLY